MHCCLTPRTWKLIVVLALLVGFTIGASHPIEGLVAFWARLETSDKDWLDVMTMIGTVASAVAAFIAAWIALEIAGSAARKQKEDAKGRAALAAAGAVPRLNTARESMVSLCQNCDDIGADGLRDPTTHNIVSHFITVADENLDIERLPDLMALSSECAHRIARAKSLIYVVRTRFEKKLFLFNAAPANPKAEHEIRQEICTIMANISEARDLLSVALDECIESARIRPPHPGGHYVDGLLLEH